MSRCVILYLLCVSGHSVGATRETHAYCDCRVGSSSLLRTTAEFIEQTVKKSCKVPKY